MKPKYKIFKRCKGGWRQAKLETFSSMREAMKYFERNISEAYYTEDVGDKLWISDEDNPHRAFKGYIETVAN